MTTKIPPPGPERDVEIARAILDPDEMRKTCWCTAHYVVYRVTGPECRTCGLPLPSRYSTDPAACDRLIEEMTREGGWVLDLQVRSDGCSARFHSDLQTMRDVEAETIEDAVSAAALLALRDVR